MYLMSYFKREPATGMFLAASDYLYDWHILNGGQPVLLPDENHILRDPFIIRTSDGFYHALFTDNWEGKTIGFCTSRNLTEWCRIEHIPLMSHHPDAMNCWSPRAFFNRDSRTYHLIWSTGLFYSDGMIENRIWTSMTRDFIDFTKPEAFFDPDYTVLDAVVLPTEGGYRMAYKGISTSYGNKHDYRYVMDERDSSATVTKALRTCRFRRPGSDFVGISDPITVHESSAPALASANGRIFLFYEGGINHSNHLLVSDDFVNWHEETDLVNFPDECKHISICECPASDIRRIW